jgi:phage terminase Nu1 subunit (DNA packaging protein)
MPNDAEVSSEELGRWLDISGRAVRDLVLRCVFEKTKRGHYLLASSVTRYCDHLRKLATGRGGETSIATATANARLIAAQADPVEAKNARERGALLDSAAVEKTWSDIVRQSRAAVLAVPSRCQQRLPLR